MNRAKLEYEMKIRNITTEMLCEAIGMSRSAFWRKKTGASQFTQKEIVDIVNYLHLESPMGVFFDPEVS